MNLHMFSLAVGLLSWIAPSRSLSIRPSSLTLSHCTRRPIGVTPSSSVWNWKDEHNRNRSHWSKKCTYHNIVLLPTIPEPSLQSTIYISIYIFITNLTYLLRRSHIRKMPKRKLLQIRLAREAGVSIPLYITNIFIWQLFVTILFPSLELISRIFGYVSYYYFYPNASGFGIIWEPLSAQSLSMSERAKHQIRCDWHRFSVNVGAIGRDGYRHPPSVSKHAPHIDIPMKGLKHWPWRRKMNVQRGIKDR